ncbi:DUF3379 family protein [Elongatibacter sediminis]|uniref:DUF3379 family protein n=1 Tax=Elongatibacter sediminis TaxID=3119006 RepID=A0AAW9RK60_9GAMM
MNFSEFKRLLGAEPGNRDPEFLRARESSPEFAEAAAESDRLEAQLKRALDLPVPAGLIDEIKQTPQRREHPPLRYFALAASVLLAALAAIAVWRVDTGPVPIEEYVANHFNHDGSIVLQRGEGQVADNVQELLASFDLTMDAEAAGKVGYMMLCPTPEGVGVHFMVHTENGPVTVIVMPETAVSGGEHFAFNGMHAELIALDRGSAAIIAPQSGLLAGMDAFVQQSIVPAELGS